MRRLRLFEFNEIGWLPSVLRETLAESLSRTMEWAGMTRAVAPFVSTFLARCPAPLLLDLCSGAGGPTAELAGRVTGRPVTFILSDLHPLVDVWAHCARSDPGRLTYVRDPVDARAVAPPAGPAPALMMINAFHHFSPAEAVQVLRSATQASPGIFLVESFTANPLRLTPCALFGLPAILVNPFLTRRKPLVKFLLTWVLPVAPLAFVWDGVVSWFRMYLREDLASMTSELTDFEWEYGEFSFPPLGRGSYFYGVPCRPGRSGAVSVPAPS